MHGVSDQCCPRRHPGNGFIHQIPCKNGGIVFILHTSEIVGTLCKVLGVVLIPLLAGLVAEILRPVRMAAAGQSCPAQLFVNAAVCLPVVFQRVDNTDVMLLSEYMI